MKEYLGIPHFTAVDKSSYLDMYFSIINALGDDFETDKELISWDVKDIKYRFYLDGLRKTVLTELLDTVGNISQSILVDGHADSDDSDDSTKFYNLLSTLKSDWSPETKYIHDHL